MKTAILFKKNDPGWRTVNTVNRNLQNTGKKKSTARKQRVGAMLTVFTVFTVFTVITVFTDFFPTREAGATGK